MTRRRRGRGEGSVFERADGLWVGTISLGYNAQRKRDRRTVYGSTKAEALAKLDALRAEARVGTLPEASSLTVGRLLDRWLDSARSKMAVRSFEERERIVNNHLKPRLGGVKLAKLNALHVEGMIADMQRDKAAPWTVRHAATVLQTVLTYAVKLKLISSNPATAVQKPSAPVKEMLCLDDDQSRRVMAAGKGQQSHALIVAALGTGCRQGELLALLWDDIDLKAGTLTVRRSLSWTKGRNIVKEPKTAASRRTITLPAFAVEALTAHKAAQLKRGLLASPVFSTSSGNHLMRSNVLRALRAIIGRANTAGGDKVRQIPVKLRFHDLRHTHASLLLSKGQSLRAVSQRLGHSNPALTLRVYAHCLPSDDAQLAEGLNRMMA